MLIKKWLSIRANMVVIPIGLLALGVSACSMKNNTAAQLQSIDLKDVAAVITTAEIEDYSPVTKNDDGYVIFVHSNGSLNHIKISGVRSQDISWENDSLVFLDRDNDYWFKDNGEVMVNSSPKTDVGDAIVSLDGGRKRLSVMNNGFADSSNSYDQFNEQVIISSSDKSEKNNISKWVRNLSVCENTVYGMGLFPDPEFRDSNIFHPELMKIYENGKISGEPISQKRSILGNISYSSGNLPCVDNKIYAIVEDSRNRGEGIQSSLDLGKSDPNLTEDLPKIYEGESEKLFAIEQWDAKTGERIIKKLINQDGTTFSVNESDIEQSRMSVGSSALRGKHLYWVFNLNTIYRTNIESGITEKFELEDFSPHQINEIEYSINFDEDKIYILSHNLNETEKDSISYLRTFDMDENRELERIEIKGVFHGMDSFQSLSGFGINPQGNLLLNTTE